MKKTRQTVISILSLIIILTFAGSAFAEEACVIKGSLTGCFYYNPDYGIDSETRPIPDYEVRHFIEPTLETGRTQQAALEAYNKVFVSGEYITPAEPEWEDTTLCYEKHYYYMNYMGSEIEIEDFLACTSGKYIHQWWYLSYSSSSDDGGACDGTWDVVCGIDSDADSIPDSEDNCPAIDNPNQEDADTDGNGDLCDNDTVYGTISGAVQDGVNVGIYRPNCGGDILLDTATTNSEGYYAFGNLSNGWHTIVPELEGYTFAPEINHPKIPQAEIISYDFMTRFIDNGDGTVTDNLTGLIWLKKASCLGALDWSEAKSTVAGLESGECELSDGSVPGDWRMPTFNELSGISTVMPATPFQYVEACPEDCDEEVWWTVNGSSAMGVMIIFMGGPTPPIRWPDWELGYTWAVKNGI